MSRRRALLALALAATCAAAPARADGDGSAMFGIASDPAATGDPGAACRAAEPVAPVAPLTPLAPLGDEVLRLVESGELVSGVVAPPAPTPAARPRVRILRGERADRAGRAALDTLVAVRPGTRLELHNFGGTIRVATWAKNAIRVQAEHSRRDWIEFARDKNVLRVESASRLGPAQAVEFRLTLPAWMAISLSGVYNDVTADGVEGGIAVETVRGDIAVTRAMGLIDLRSVEGLVDLTDAKGNVKVSSINDGVRLLRVSGDIEAEAVNGDIQLLDLVSSSVEATTVNGAVLYDSKVFDGGSYRFSTHNGDIAVALAEAANATVSVSTYDGEFAAPFPIRLGRSEHGKRFSFALGTGKAQIDLESFQGGIRLFRPGDRAMLARFRQSWAESERDRAREMKWILKGEASGEDDEDAPDEDAPAPASSKKPHK